MPTLLTFLGTARYAQTTYVLGRQRHTTCYCTAAVAHFFRPEKTLVVVTQGAAAMHYDSLAAEIAGVTRPEPVPIPDGHSESDLWAIFDALTDRIGVGAELIVDITNGFRSLPFLSFLALAFLRVAKQVQVRGVYYGAYDARDQQTNESPVFDLTPFVTLLDWTVATDQFLATGDTQPLADRVKEAHRLPWQARAAKERGALPRNLQGVAQTLETLGRALRLVRPEEAMRIAAGLLPQIEAVRGEAESWAKPFGLLLDRTAEDYRPLALAADPRDPAQVAESLRIQRSLVRWYVERRQYVQAIILAREWVISYVIHLLGWDMINDRDLAERLLSTESMLRRQKRGLPLDATTRERLEGAILLWDRLPDLRNDIAHVGMRREPRAVTSIITAARGLPDDLEKLPIG